MIMKNVSIVCLISLICGSNSYLLSAGSSGDNKSTVNVKKMESSEKKPKLSRSLQNWLNKMKKRVSRSEAKHNRIVSVGAVRGAESDANPALYWKGEKSSGPVDLPEIQAFDQAVDMALSGDSEKAIKTLNDFKTTYPKSALTNDIDETLKMLQENTGSTP